MTSLPGLKPRGVLGCCALGLAIWFGAFGLSSRMKAQSPTLPSYTEAQAERGRAAYATHCASCHGQYLDDGTFAPPLKGVDFRTKWGGSTPQPVDALFNLISTKMPPDTPGTLGDPTYAQLLAYIFQENGAPVGPKELPTDSASLKAMAAPSWPPSSGGVGPQYVSRLADGVTLPAPPPRTNPLDTIRPVTDAMLYKPADSEWLSWRRTYDAFGFSPLKKINRSNVSELRVAWSWALPNGPNESVPLVHDGVMFISSFGDKVQALDAVTGDMLWQYSRRLPSSIPPTVKRSIAIYGNLLYMPTSDVHIVALDVKTGKVSWDQVIADPKVGYGMTAGPIVAAGKVFVGTKGRAAGGNYIVALDPLTGKEIWRFYTVARPGGPGGNSWNGIPLEKRNGGSIWLPGSFDAAHNLVLFGPGNTYDTAPIRTLSEQPGVTNDALYLDSTLALNPDTGQLVWYFQHQANGQWDLDWAFERQVMQLPVNGVSKSVVVTAGKQMIFDFVEAEGGKYLSSLDLGREAGLQNIVTAIDVKTGAKTVDANLVPGDGKTKMICPHVDGGRDWMPTSYDSSTGMLYIPSVEACMDMVPVPKGERGSLSTGVRWTVRPKPGTDGKYGRLMAVNLQTMKTVWVDRQRAPLTSAVLATAGGLVFVGGLDRMFSAHDALTGAELWKTRLNDVPATVPISYSVKGQEYVAIVAGKGGSQSNAYTALVPEMQNPPEHGTTMWVFEVPTKAPGKSTR